MGRWGRLRCAQVSLDLEPTPTFSVPPPACLQVPYLFSTYYARGTKLGCGTQKLAHDQ